MAAVSWTYPQDQLIAIRKADAEAARVAPIASGINPTALDFAYRIDGDRPAWRPVRAFDDGRQAYIEFTQTIRPSEMPPLFLHGSHGQAGAGTYWAAGREAWREKVCRTGK